VKKLQLALGAVLCCALISLAEEKKEEKKKEPPKTLMVVPLAIETGASTTIKVRGLRLDTASAVKFIDAKSPIDAKIKSKGKVEVPKPLEAPKAGDTQVEIELKLPQDLPTGPLQFVITTPEELVRFLNGVYTKLDSLVERHGLEKIKTTGDAYMVVSGVPEPRPDHAAELADLALDMRDALAGLTDPKGRAVPVRIGIASGPVVAGVVGTRKFFYDVWGDAVNTASRMESTGEAGKIQVAPATRELLAGRFELQERGIIEVRGKGPMQTCFLIGRKREAPETA